MNQGPSAGILLPGSTCVLSVASPGDDPRLKAGTTPAAIAVADASVEPLTAPAQAPASDAAPTTPLSLWHPDVAALLSLVFTPVFGAALHALNAWELGDSRLRRVALVWLLLALAFTASGLYLVTGGVYDLMSGFATSALLGGYTIIWYTFAAHKQSRLMRDIGRAQWQPRSFWLPALIALGLMLAPAMLSGLHTRL